MNEELDINGEQKIWGKFQVGISNLICYIAVIYLILLIDSGCNKKSSISIAFWSSESLGPFLMANKTILFQSNKQSTSSCEVP